MIEHEAGVRTSRTIEFKRLDEDFFSEEAEKSVTTTTMSRLPLSAISGPSTDYDEPVLCRSEARASGGLS